MDNSEQIEFPMGDELKLSFSLDYLTKSLALSVWQKTEPSEGEEAEHDMWNLLSKVHFHNDHPTKLWRALNELTPIDEKTQ